MKSINGTHEETVSVVDPKATCANKKFSMSSIPPRVLAEVANAMTEGAVKYGYFNYRGITTSGSMYYDAAMRHLMQWFEGEDIDPDSGISHVTKAISGLIVLRDSMMNGTWHDDRPPKSEGWVEEQNKKAELIQKTRK